MDSTKRNGRRRVIAVATTVAAVLVGGGIAIAYWTASGSGTGTATAGSGTTNLTVTSNVPSGLYPGGPAQPIDLTVSSPAAGNVLNGVSISVTGTGVAGCDPTWFTVTQPTIAANTALSVGANSFPSSSTNADISLVNSAANQDACKGVTVSLAFTAS